VTPFEQRDYIMRQVKVVAAMIARMTGLRAGGAHEAAHEELERAYDELLGTEAPLVRRVDAATAVLLLGPPERVAAYARLLIEEATQSGDAAQQADRRGRAVRLALEAARVHGNNEAIRSLLAELAPGNPPSQASEEDVP
jgi:hypothetical protein